MSARFVISHMNEQQGPFSEDELKARWASGDLLPIDYVYVDAKNDWILITDHFDWAVNPPPLTAVTKKRKPDAPAVNSTVVKEWRKPQGLGAKVKLVDGVGEVDLGPAQPGQIELVLQDASTGILKLQSPLKIQVRNPEPVAIHWSYPATSVVGHEVVMHLKAVDDRGQVCAPFQSGDFELLINDRSLPVHFHAGEARVPFTHTKAEVTPLRLQQKAGKMLNIPSPAQMEWQAGVAVKLVLDGPQEWLAGQPVRVQVKAVDAYGNLAKNFQGTVILEVKAS